MRYFIATYHRTPNGKYNESVKLDDKVRNRDLQSASVIIDYKERKVIKSRFQGELGDSMDRKDFDTINTFFKGHYTEVISQLEAKYQVLDEIVEGVKAELKGQVEAAVEVKKATDATEVAIDVGAVAQAHPEIIQDEIDNEIIADLKVIAESDGSD